MDSDSDESMEGELPEPLIDPETLLMVEAAKRTTPGLFVSGWEADEDGVADKDMMDPGEQFLTAAEDGELETLKQLLDEHPTLLDVRDSDLYAPMHRASYNNHPEIVQFLLSQGCDPRVRTEEHWTPLHCAACWGSFEVAQVLLKDSRVDVNARTKGNLTPLHLAVACTDDPQNAVKTASLLFSTPNIDINAVSGAGETAKELAHRTSKLMYELLSN